MATEITIRNRRSLESLMELMGDGIDVKSAEKDGEYWFVCGDLKGHVAKPAAQKMIQENDWDPSHYHFAEVKNDEGKWIPEIMRSGKPSIGGFKLRR